MRAGLLVIAIASLASCTPDIASGTYLCGPEESCPAGQSCNGPDNTCVIDSSALPFTCGALTETEPNNTIATAQSAGTLACVSPPTEFKGCAEGADSEDWYKVHIPDICTSVEIVTRIAFANSFEPLLVEIRDATGAVLATGAHCSGAPDGDDVAEDAICVNQTATPGADYEVRVARAGRNNCGGACAYNRYTVSIRLATP